MLVFTEVRTQTSGHGWGEPHVQIDEKKSDRIINAVQHYMDMNELDCNFRFDVAEVILGSGEPQIQIIKDGIHKGEFQNLTPDDFDKVFNKYQVKINYYQNYLTW